MKNTKQEQEAEKSLVERSESCTPNNLVPAATSDMSSEEVRASLRHLREIARKTK